MSQLALYDEVKDLTQFFAHLDQCTDKNPMTHGLHPYPAKFIPHIPRALIQHYARPGGVVLDPMCGSGTTLVEAILAGHQAIGVDRNPVAVLISQAKTTPLSPAVISELRTLIRDLRAAAVRFQLDESSLHRLVSASELPDFRNRAHWFQDNVVWELAYVKSGISQLTESAGKTAALCAFSASLVGVSNQESETRWCAKPRTIMPGQASARIADKIEQYIVKLRDLQAQSPAKAVVLLADARRIPVEAGTIDLVLTSPPYANAHDYYLYNKLRLFWLGYDVREIQASEIGSRNRHSDQREDIETYVTAMKAVLNEVSRVLVHNGRAIFVVADAVVRGVLYRMDSIFEVAAKSVGLSLTDQFEFAHRDFNASFQHGFGTRRQKTTHVLVFGRTGS